MQLIMNCRVTASLMFTMWCNTPPSTTKVRIASNYSRQSASVPCASRSTLPIHGCCVLWTFYIYLFIHIYLLFIYYIYCYLLFYISLSQGCLDWPSLRTCDNTCLCDHAYEISGGLDWSSKFPYFTPGLFVYWTRVLISLLIYMYCLLLIV